MEALATSEDKSTDTGKKGKKKKKKTGRGGIREKVGSVVNIFQRAGNSGTEGNTETESLEKPIQLPAQV